MNIRSAQTNQNAPGTRLAGSTSPPPEIKHREDAANYVTAMLAELRQIAGKAGLNKMVKALDAAYYEACAAIAAEVRNGTSHPRNGPVEKTLKSMEPDGR
jgi:hypothetical protein